MEHIKNYKKYKGFYESGWWTKKMLHNVTEKGELQPWEYEEITGCEF